MRSVFSQKIGLAIVLALAVQRARPIPTARAAVIQRGSTPFLIGPPDDVVTSAETSDRDTQTGVSTSTTSAKSAQSSTTTTVASSTPSQSSSTTTLSSSSSPSASDPPIREDDDEQPSSIKYLVPVFLLIVITLAGWGYSRWYARKRQDEYEEAKRTHQRGEWNKIDGDDDADEKDPWYAGDSDGEAHEVDWQDVELAPAKSSGAISAAGRGWGWRSTMTAWKSARGRAGDEGEEEVDEMGKTIRLVPHMPDSVTYQTLPDLQGRPIDRVEDRGSIQALRDKLASLTFRDQTTPKRLDRSRAANKRKGKVEPPAAPAWIQPRATSPVQALSPPLQPHLFFHPSGQSLHGMMLGTAGTESGSEYGSEDEQPHKRFPTIPSTASALENNLTPVPERKSRRIGTEGSTESVVDGDAGEATPRATKSVKRSATTRGRTPTMRRSAATHDLTSPMNRSRTTRDRSTTSPRKKTKAQRKADKAHDKVEDILKASWSDRALASPTSCMSLDGAVAATHGAVQEGSMSPGVEEAAVLGGMGGIEQRLAMLRNVEI